MAEKTTTEPNPYKLIVNTFSQASTSGGSNSYNSYQSSSSSIGGYGDDQDINTTFNDDNDCDELGDRIREKVHRDISRVQRNLKNQFSNGFWQSWNNFFNF